MKKHKNFIIKPLIKIFFYQNGYLKKIEKFVILIIGGSQGARKFDNLFSRDLIKLSKIILRFFIKLVIKINKLKTLFINKINSRVFSYTNYLHEIIKKCDFVITRSEQLQLMN